MHIKDSLSKAFPWASYSRKLSDKILRARSVGSFTEKDAKNRSMQLAFGKAGSVEDGNIVSFYWLVDPEDGIIVDAKFQVFGQSALIGAAEASCNLVVGKNYDQARRISADLIDQQLRDRSDQPSFPHETAPHLNLALEAIDIAAESCEGIPLAPEYSAPPVTFDPSRLVQEGGYQDWDKIDKQQKLAVIEDVIGREIRPYIELDGGGIEVLDILNDREIIVAYQGACTSCFAATGATLSYMQQVVQTMINPNLVVVPDLTGHTMGPPPF